MGKVFFQDFLLQDLPVDEQDNPLVTLKEYSPCYSSKDMELSLDRLLRMNKQSEWNELFHALSGKVVIIKDDVDVSNNEIQNYKEFYLKTYFFNISAYAKECYIERTASSAGVRISI